MTREDLSDLEKKIMEEVVKRRKLGGYSVEADGILTLAEAMLKVLQHLIEKAPRKQ